jgi:hypothetical protein
MPSDDDLCAWIRALRDRCDRGELAGHPPVDIGYGTSTLPAEHTSRIMLADLDSFDDLTDAQRDHRAHVRRRLGVLNDFRRLREVIG